jgi:outer membrane protein assembly factor BamA
VKYNIVVYRFIERISRPHFTEGAGLQLRGTLLTSLIALTLTALSAVQAPAEALVVAGGTQEQGQTVETQSPAMPAEDAMARYQGLIVAEIRLPDISSDADQKRWRDLIPQKTGEPLDRELIRESIHALHRTGRFADIRVEGQRTDDGKVDLLFFTTSNYFVGRVNVLGVPNRPTAGQVVNASKLQLGELFSSDQVERSLANIKQLMQENGYYRSSVNEQEQKDPARQQIDILFQIDPGPQAHVGIVTVLAMRDTRRSKFRALRKCVPGNPFQCCG